ncbi:MAG: DUF4241 domain-containing protein [Actinoplanes sp.]
MLILAGLSLAGCAGPAPRPVPTEDRPPVRSPAAAASLFRPGSQHMLTTGDEAVAEVVQAGTLRLPTGRLVAVDPSWLPAASWTPPVGPFTATVPPGAYPVELAVLRGPDTRVAAARLTVSDEPVRRWEPALLAGQDPATLAPGEFFGTGVDIGVLALTDATAMDALGDLDDRNPEMFDLRHADRPLRVPDVVPGADAVAFTSGWGDGYYPTWVGRTATGGVACFIVDMLMLAPPTGSAPLAGSGPLA